jgi:hypothetical protein
MEGLLDQQLRRQLIANLEVLPGVDANWPPVRAILLKRLPRGIAGAITYSGMYRVDIFSLVNTLERNGMQLVDGSWPILIVIENALEYSASSGLRLEQELHDLLLVARARQNIQSPEGLGLEALLKQRTGFQSVAEWARRLSAVIPPICRVEVHGAPVGTGWLVGPNLVLTNYHVTHQWRSGAWVPFAATQLGVRFDYHLPSVQASDTGLYRILDEPLPQSPQNELDFALLRVDGKPADDVVGGFSDGLRRGYLALQDHPLAVGDPLFIIQHPQGRPMEIAFDLVTAVQSDRIEHHANTEEGSSGSPCFDKAWNVVALHRATNADRTANKAIPIGRILAVPEVQSVLDS